VSPEYSFDPRNVEVLREEPCRIGGFANVYKGFDKTTGVEESSRIIVAVKEPRGAVTKDIIDQLEMVGLCY
jgi:hypothetical protein